MAELVLKPTPDEIATARRWVSRPPRNYVPAGDAEEERLRELIFAALDALAEVERLREQVRPAIKEGFCPAMEDETHCNHWWDGHKPCCACGDNTPAPERDDG